MPLPSSRKKPHGWWKPRTELPDAESPEDENLSSEDETKSDQLIFCPSCEVGNLLRHDEDASDLVCVICRKPLVIEEIDQQPRSIIANLFEPITGIRQRFRQPMGYRRVRSLFEIDVDPNLDLKGDRLRVAMQEWLEEEHTSWDRKKRRRRVLWDDRPWFFFTMLGLAAVALAAGTFFVVSLKENFDASPLPPPAAPSPRAALRESLPAELARAEPVAIAFFAAESIDDLLPLIRDRTRVTTLVSDYYSSRKFEPVVPADVSVVDAANYGGRKFLRLGVKLDNGALYGLTLEDLHGDYLVDWESFVGYSEVDWSEFKAGAPNSGRSVKLRAYASFIEQYLAPFDDQKHFQSILLKSIDGESLVGYIPRLEDQCVQLRAKIAETGKNSYEVIVRVRYREQNWTPHEVEIAEIVQTGWVEWDRQPRPAE